MIYLKKMENSDLSRFKSWLYTPHVAKWYHNPLDWLHEVEEQERDFSWIHHFIVMYGDLPIGFCQYYACKDSDEPWAGYTARGGSYSIDYMIGEAAYLRQGLGKQIVAELIKKIKSHGDAKRIVVQPEPDNIASCHLLLSCGFNLDREKGIYVSTV